MSCVVCRVSCVVCRVSCVVCRVSYLVSYDSQAFIAMQIPEPKDFQGLGLPRVLYTSPGYASLSLFPTVHHPPPCGVLITN